MKLNFTKMHGLGNDFVVINAIEQPVQLTLADRLFLADRRLGVGCDQILLVEASDIPEVDFRYRIFNADGQEVEQCGNGARCFARYIQEKKLSEKNPLTVETLAGIISLQIEKDQLVTVNMGVAHFDPAAIPFQAAQAATVYNLNVGDETYPIGAVSMGNPHAVLLVNNIETAAVDTLGSAIMTHPRFPKQVNVGFMQIVNRQTIFLRVYERGSGETLACGTGACAAVVVGQRWQALDETVTVHLPGGGLRIHWSGDADSPVWMTGPAVSVFEGEIIL